MPSRASSRSVPVSTRSGSWTTDAGGTRPRAASARVDADLWINGGYFVLRGERLRCASPRRGAGRGAVPAARRGGSPAHRLATRVSGRRWTRSGTSRGSRPLRASGRPPWLPGRSAGGGRVSDSRDRLGLPADRPVALPCHRSPSGRHRDRGRGDHRPAAGRAAGHRSSSGWSSPPRASARSEAAPERHSARRRRRRSRCADPGWPRRLPPVCRRRTNEGSRRGGSGGSAQTSCSSTAATTPTRTTALRPSSPGSSVAGRRSSSTRSRNGTATWARSTCTSRSIARIAERKVEHLLGAFPSQAARDWFTADTFRAILRLRGIESRSPSRARRGIRRPQARRLTKGDFVRVLVTGHLGYIGTVLVPEFLAAGHDVVGLDSDLYRDCTFGDPARLPTVPTIERDLRDVTADDVRGFDAVVHLAALSNDPLGDLDRGAHLRHQPPRIGPRSRAPRARPACPRFLFSSSCSNYGAAGGALLDETSPLRPVTAYGESKVRVGARTSQGSHELGLRRRLAAQRDGVRRIASAPLRRGRQQPRRMGLHDRPRAAQERRHAMAPARPHPRHRAGVPARPRRTARRRQRQGVQRRRDRRATTRSATSPTSSPESCRTARLSWPPTRRPTPATTG